MMNFKNVIDECLETVEEGILNLKKEEIEKYYLETKSPFFYERIRTFSNIEKIENFKFVLLNKKHMYNESVYNKLLSRLNEQLNILKNIQ